MKPYIVYKTINTVNNKFYIGVHKRNGRNYLGSGVALRHAIKKYGKENFKRVIIEEFDTKQEAFDYESIVVNKVLVDSKMCYNLCDGGYGSDPPSHKGKKRSEETKKKMSNNHADFSGSNNPMFGKQLSESHREKISSGKKGSKNPMYGKKGKDAPRSKPCVIDGIEYESVIGAARSLNKNKQTIRNWLRSTSKPNCYYGGCYE